MNSLLERSEQMPFYTDLAVVFRALDGRERDYHWIITDFECIALNAGSLPAPFRETNDDRILLSGRTLMSLVSRQPIQFVWGVLSGFVPDRVPELGSLNPVPFADGNEALWRPGVTLQHPLAEVEIVCWDSSATMFLSRQEDLTRQFRAFFPDAVDLDTFNARRALADGSRRPNEG